MEIGSGGIVGVIVRCSKHAEIPSPIFPALASTPSHQLK